MRILWTLVKVVVALALVIPASVILLATAVGVFGALVGLAFMTLRLAVVGLIAYGVFRVAKALLGGGARHSQENEVRALPAVDPHYEAAMRELDRELGHTTR